MLTIAFGSWKDALFVGILISNIAIGSFQEIRSKRALDRLAALVTPEAVVVRDGVDRRVPVDRVVVGDLVRLKALLQGSGNAIRGKLDTYLGRPGQESAREASAG